MKLPRLYPILDTRSLHIHSCDALAAAEAIVHAGAGILQFRHKEFFDRQVFHAASRIAELCRARGVPLVINDRVDFAMLVGGGVHLGQDDLPPEHGRRLLGEHAWIGLSTHNESQFRAAADQPVDYLAFGPIFATGSKGNPDPVTGTLELRRIRPLSEKPVAAIGGITRANAREVLAAGADSVAVIGDLYGERVSPLTIGRRVEEWLKILADN